MNRKKIKKSRKGLFGEINTSVERAFNVCDDSRHCSDAKKGGDIAFFLAPTFPLSRLFHTPGIVLIFIIVTYNASLQSNPIMPTNFFN